MGVRKPPKPAGLGPEGARLWREVTSEMAEDGLVPSAQERRWLTDACREADLCADLMAALVDQPRTVRGSQGQPVVHPLISELRQHRTVLGALLARVSTADPQAVTGSGSRTTSSQARAAALTRHHGLVG